MATPLLVLAILAMGVVVFWYVLDEATRGGEGRSGILGMSDKNDEPAPDTSKSGWKRGNARPWRVRRH
jgi:hypothetical protein